MKRYSLFGSILAAFGIGSLANARITTANHGPDPVIPPLPMPRRREPRIHFAPGGRRRSSVHHSSSNYAARMAKREENDARAAALNYPGWCGFEDSGSSLAS